ncbi:MAG: hypothetical protein ACKVQS_06540 [Fimbriimonadaceae bacterium]
MDEMATEMTDKAVQQKGTSKLVWIVLLVMIVIAGYVFGAPKIRDAQNVSDWKAIEAKVAGDWKGGTTVAELESYLKAKGYTTKHDKVFSNEKAEANLMQGNAEKDFPMSKLGAGGIVRYDVEGEKATNVYCILRPN